jgi:threonine dehydrogenase-like Zn-dependent dehydrogenase
VQVIRRLTGGIGVDRAIDAVGVDATTAVSGPAAREAAQHEKDFQGEVASIAPRIKPEGPHWMPGNAPSQALTWAVDALAKAGTLSLIGVYPETMQSFPIGKAMEKNLTIQMGNCNHRRYIPSLIRLIQSGAVDPLRVLTQREPMTSAIAAYEAFDERRPGWMKVELRPAA